MLNQKNQVVKTEPVIGGWIVVPSPAPECFVSKLYANIADADFAAAELARKLGARLELYGDSDGLLSEGVMTQLDYRDELYDGRPQSNAW